MIKDIITEDCDKFHQLSVDNKLDFSVLKDTTILVTGGTGFFGKWILTTFLFVNDVFNLNIKCIVLTRSSNSFLEKYPNFKSDKLTYIEGDIRNFSIPEFSIDYIIHAATPASATLERDYPDEMESIIVEGAEHIIEVAQKCNVKRILFTSSGGVYGESISENPFKETDICNPTTVYGKSKLYAEEKLLISNIDTVIARCFAFVGPYLELDIHYAIGNFIKDCIDGTDIKIKGDGRPLRSYMYSLDLMFWLWTLLLKAESNSIYNVGSNNSITIAELATHVSKDTLSNVIVSNSLQNSNNESRSCYIPDISKVVNDFGLKLSYSLEESIERTKKWSSSKECLRK